LILQIRVGPARISATSASVSGATVIYKLKTIMNLLSKFYVG